MIDKLDAIKGRYEQVSLALTNPEVVKDNKQFSKLSKEYRQLEKIVKAYDNLSQVTGCHCFQQRSAGKRGR